jgi:nicotinamide N-methyltransferase
MPHTPVSNEEDSTEDIFESSLYGLFAQPIIAHSLPTPTSLFTFTHPYLPSLPASSALSHPIEPSSPPQSSATTTSPSPPSLKLAIPIPQNSNNALQAHYIWPSSLYLSHLLLTSLVPLHPSSRILELGAGSGASSVVAAYLSKVRGLGCEVVSTDYGDEGIVRCLEGNFERNLGDGTEGKGKDWDVRGFAWGENPDELLRAPSSRKEPPAGQDEIPSIPKQNQREPKPFDLLLCSDLLFFTPSHSALLSSVLSLLAPSPSAFSSSSPSPLSSSSTEVSASIPEAHLTAGMHGGRGAIDRFVKMAEEEGGCVVEDRGVVIWDPKEQAWERVERKEDEEGEGRVWWGVLRRKAC